MPHPVVPLLVSQLPGDPARASHTMTSWSESVASSSSEILQFSSILGDVSVRSMIEWLLAPGPDLVPSSLL